jgi:hypothetical protein
MLTLRQLVVATPRPILSRSLMQCRVHITKATEDLDEFGNTVKECSALVRATDGDRYCTIMIYQPDIKNLALSKVWLHCSCPYYTFNVEVVNAMKRSSDILNSNGEMPRIRNPRMIPHLCKHLIALARLAIKAKYKVVGQLAIEEKAQKKFDEQAEKEAEEKKEADRKAGKLRNPKVPPARTIERPGKQPGKQALKRPTPLKTGPKGPAGPKSVMRPKSIKRPGQR